jgi:hypothetical protein
MAGGENCARGVFSSMRILRFLEVFPVLSAAFGVELQDRWRGEAKKNGKVIDFSSSTPSLPLDPFRLSAWLPFSSRFIAFADFQVVLVSPA